MLNEIKSNNRLSELYALRKEHEAILLRNPDDFTAKHVLTWVMEDIKKLRQELHQH